MAFFEQTRITDANGNVINPAQQQTLYSGPPPEDNSVAGVIAPAVRSAPGSIDEHLILLRRLVRATESLCVVDTAQRQRVTIDAGTLPTVTTVGTVSTITAGTITTVQAVNALAGWDQRMFSDPARTAYNTGIRAGLTFS